MDWAEQIERHRRALIVAGISLVHGAAFAAVLTLKITTPPPIPAQPIIIELAEIVEAPQPEPEPDPAPELPPPTPEPATEPKPTPPPQQSAEAPPPSPVSSAPLPVLTQNAGDPSPSEQTPVITSDALRSDLPPGAPTATPDQLANVLARANCRRQIATQDPECEDQDPFDALAEKFELQQAAALVPPELNGAYAPGAFERYMSGEGHYSSPQGRDASAGSQLHLWPDQDLFEEGQSRSTNQGNRIRNGKGLMNPALERELRAVRD